MEETGRFSNSRLSLSSIIEVRCDHDDDELMEHTEEVLFLECDSTMQGKNNKKKKKHKGGLQSPKGIVDFNTSELLKLEEHKAEMKKCATRCASFPASAALKVNSAVVENGEGSGDSEDLNEHMMLMSSDDKTSALTRCVSLPTSALRGSYEELGFGPRPKLHVKWAPSVWEPPCSIISHTVNNNHSKKKDSKHGHRGRSSRDDLHKKQDKRKPHKVKCNSGSSTPRRHGASNKDEGGESESSMQAEILSGASEELFIRSTQVLKQVGSGTIDSGDIKCELATQKGCEVADARPTAVLKSDIIDGFQYSNDSMCAGSLLGSGGVPCNLLYAQAM